MVLKDRIQVPRRETGTDEVVSPESIGYRPSIQITYQEIEGHLPVSISLSTLRKVFHIAM
jgi:hypothetical protein